MLKVPNVQSDDGGQGTQDAAVEPRPWDAPAVVGKPLPRVDSYERVSGSAVYTLDVRLPGMLHVAIVRCPFAHARVIRLDASVASKMPGVRAVLTVDDPEAAIEVPKPWWVTDGPPVRLFDRHCRFHGDEVAAIAADSANQAWDAARAVRVEYEQLPFVVDHEAALKPRAPAVHDAGNLVRKPSVQQRGDVEKGFAEADVVVERSFRTSTVVHTTMETFVSVANWEGNRLTVWDSTQGVFEMRQYIASCLKMPYTSVRVICHYMGGGFGAKAELGKHTVLAVLLARRTGRPVQAALTREESLHCTGNRPPATMTLKAGVRKDGTLTALRFTMTNPSGAYADDDSGGYQVLDLYRCPNVRVETTQVFVNASKARAMRAPGEPPTAWALEQVMDELAERIGMDAVEMRLKNIPTVSQAYRGAPYTTTGLARCLAEGAQAFGWAQARARRRGDTPIVRGVGVAAGIWPAYGDNRATVIVKVAGDGSVSLNFGAMDIGTGTKTVMAMVVAEELGVAPDRIEIEQGDTATSPFAVQSGGSQTVIVNAPAARSAALDVKRQILDMAAAQLKVSAAGLALRDGAVVVADDPARRLAFKDLEELRSRQIVMGVGKRAPHPRGKVGFAFGAHFAEVEVNTRTGEVRVVRLLGAHDSGRPMNLLTYENQVVGGMTMGLGYAVTEGRVYDRQTGRVLNTNWHDYRIPTSRDVPADFTCLPIDPHDLEWNSVGAKGLGEPATIPTAPAIANAVYHATGVRITDMPIDPIHLVEPLAGRTRG